MDLRLVLHQKLLAALASVVVARAPPRRHRLRGVPRRRGRASSTATPSPCSCWPDSRSRSRETPAAVCWIATSIGPAPNYRQTVRDSSALLTRGQTIRSLMDALARHVLDATHPEGVAIYLDQDQSVSRIRRAGDGREPIRGARRPARDHRWTSLPGSAGGLWAGARRALPADARAAGPWSAAPHRARLGGGPAAPLRTTPSSARSRSGPSGRAIPTIPTISTCSPPWPTRRASR